MGMRRVVVKVNPLNTYGSATANALITREHTLLLSNLGEMHSRET